ncbi:hypothetical protein SPRG_16886 [Saprolegnia parasitica CBS 223.65]|uniref:Valyl-tRNA synthetase tRNA-binding arm domain-containing protein n=1 Tax=Saprolegnia parasitica (strain CBS 223.65) TaxID=695850 RepID=A0A067BLX2_SAPPC|nr:hypothetical protein SPRG_16886 [Saprolegnia parasitica CBS 223.65]KDO17720.1 hypothetical protein SPRG_16886 [Saprolegnia parasitica CBS 223.65]|eukprot:XP_012211571.1 hypothetical protein SPRG_16886 [Saprolegnia parasitica CBS 223.65]
MALLERNLSDIEAQCRAGPVALLTTAADETKSPHHVWLTHSLHEHCQVLLPLPIGLETSGRISAEVDRLTKRQAKAAKTLAMLSAKRADPKYAANVPEAIQAQDDERIAQASVEHASLGESLAALATLRAQVDRLQRA